MTSALQTIKHAVHSVPAGLPAAAYESGHEQVSLDSYLVSNPSTTVLFRVRGESMTGAGIFDGDLLVVDRSIEPVHGQVVVATINNDMTVNLKICRKLLMPAKASGFSLLGHMTSQVQNTIAISQRTMAGRLF